MTSSLKTTLSLIHQVVNEHKLDFTTYQMSDNKFRIYCQGIKKDLFFYSVEKQNESICVKCIFPKILVNQAPKFQSIFLNFANKHSCISIDKKNCITIYNHSLLTVDDVMFFIQNTQSDIKEIIKIISYYFAPSNFDEILHNRKKYQIKLNSESKINFGQFVIGRNSKINGSIQSKFGKVFLGQFIAGGFNIEFIAGNHIIQLPNLQATLQKQIDDGTRNKYHDEGEIDIGNNVWIGDNSVFLKDVHVGDGAVIGCNSVVTHDVPPFAVVAGVPAKVIKYRFTQDVIDQMMDIQWWNRDMEWILSQKRFFSTIIPNDKDIDVYSLLDN